jgi:hypothetical protein
VVWAAEDGDLVPGDTVGSQFYLAVAAEQPASASSMSAGASAAPRQK